MTGRHKQKLGEFVKHIVAIASAVAIAAGLVWLEFQPRVREQTADQIEARTGPLEAKIDTLQTSVDKLSDKFDKYLDVLVEERRKQ